MTMSDARTSAAIASLFAKPSSIPWASTCAFGFFSRIRFAHDIHLGPADVRQAARMPHDVADRQAVSVDEREMPHAAFGQLDGDMGAAGADPDAKNFFLGKDRGLENARPAQGELRFQHRQRRHRG